MYRHILVPVTLEAGDRAAHSIAAARALAAEGGRITLLHVAEAIPRYVLSDLPEGALAAGRDRAKARLAEIASEAGGGVETRLIEGHGARTIIAEAAESGADCIVIGSHRPEFADRLLGSTAATVVRHAPCSVHVVR